MGLTPGFRDYLFDVLAPLGKIETKRFFGLDGIKADGAMLGFVLDERIYFRTDEQSRSAYAEEGGTPFTFDKSGEAIVTSYYTIPDRLYDEPEELVRWARRARVAALKAPSAVKRREKSARKLVKGEVRKTRARVAR
jgi:DNA transformation protein and related proteins